MKIERQLQGTLNTIFTEFIMEKGLEGRIQPYTVIEENRADITLKNSSGKPIFFIELKDPTAKDGKSVFDSNVLLREVERAQRIDIRYFGNCNFLACAFFDKDKLFEKVSVNEGFFTLTDIIQLSRSYAPSKEITSKLKNIAEFYLERAIEILDKKPIKFSDLDELFIFKIRKLIEVYSHPISNLVWEKYRQNKAFEKEINRYTQSQLWNKPQTYDEIENLTHISVLMLISKLIFYKAYVDNQTWHNLSPMQVPDSVETANDLEEVIWTYFETFHEVTGNFELLIGKRSDIIFKMPFASEAVIDLVKDLLDTEGHYNFSNIPFDIIGRIFEELIRDDERHKLGQYFTPPHVIDLINAYAIRQSDDKVLDPSCGSGTFLVRAYERKKQLCAEEGKGAKHENLLNEIYGNDISNYPAYLSMLNLAIRNTRHPSYPRIANKDFFAIIERGTLVLHNQQGKLERKPLPKFDAIVGNPPYTRQEEIGSLHGTVSKPEIQSLIKGECGFEPSQRTSIFAYFFYHATTFLKEGGYLAFICQNSWLDTDYGIDMQRYLMRHYEIIAIMDSEVERFFPSASVNTTIVILRKQRDEDLCNNNTVKFIYFTSTLAEAIKNYKGVNRLQQFLETVTESTETDNFRINCIKQETLANHTKWGQFLKAPKIYFDIIDRGADKFVPLSKIADDIKFGLKTGCNDFFILKVVKQQSDEILKVVVNNIHNIKRVSDINDENLCLVINGFNEVWLIEKQFLFPMLTSPKDTKNYEVNPKDLPYWVFINDKEREDLKSNYPYSYKYIHDGEIKQINKASSLAARKKWYFLNQKQLPDLSFNYVINESGKTFRVKAYSNNNFHNIYSKDKSRTIWFYMNSTISWLIQQLIMRSNLGDGAGKIETYELADFLIPDIDLEHLNIELGETKNYKEELGTLESLATVNPERIKLDNAILERIGYTDKTERDDVLLQLYRATYQLINARLQKAQSMKSVKTQRNKIGFSVYMEQLKQMLQEGKYEARITLKFARDLEKLVSEITQESKLQKKILDAYWKEKFNKPFNEKGIADDSQMKLF